jgi:hypothetical protein
MVLQFSSLSNRVLSKVCGSLVTLFLLSGMLVSTGYGQVYDTPIEQPLIAGSHGTIMVTNIGTTGDLSTVTGTNVGEGEGGAFVEGVVEMGFAHDPGNCPGSGPNTLRVGSGSPDGTIIFPNAASFFVSDSNQLISNIQRNSNGDIDGFNFTILVPGRDLPPGQNPLVLDTDGDLCSKPTRMSIGSFDNQWSNPDRPNVIITPGNGGMIACDSVGRPCSKSLSEGRFSFF